MVSDQLLLRPNISDAQSIRPKQLSKPEKPRMQAVKSVASNPYQYTQHTLVKRAQNADALTEQWEP
jgi:hypothetical protein